ncbi:helix-turn-helix transcriptional regulator [Alkalilimnicola sp. S0819]|uniref:helix-turn-helix transcriptional regulator n=1 Tax=Alkalilimnicola sp. S0819 TaxID=2613922 RepID=UPI0012625589|nr:WYL domain-containing protein [Alkalilimnicola sp. S0819]KAB7623947.1 WYL domain-containing protein [Alkalilimnicola sp. S0819]MPQ16547.1 WYL domain-containing protein [Alkalilimnicola sp. S0819]
MARIHDTLARHHKLLQLLPTYPRRATAQELRASLGEEGFEVTLRTLQRDLHQLWASGEFAIHRDDRDSVYGWAWERDVRRVEDPAAMDSHRALLFKIMRDYSRHLLPPHTRERFEPIFHSAQQFLDQRSELSPSWLWTQRVRVLPPGQRLLPPSVDAALVETLYEALMGDHRVRLRYRTRSRSGELRDYELTPLGLVFRDETGLYGYLLGCKPGESRAKQFALHRIEQLELTDLPAAPPADFDLDEYIAQGGFDVLLSEQRLALELRLSEQLAVHLEERPLSADQHLRRDEEGRWRLRATVPDTRQLRWWLAGLGDGVQVLQPQGLRDELVRGLQAALAAYQD